MINGIILFSTALICLVGCFFYLVLSIDKAQDNIKKTN